MPTQSSSPHLPFGENKNAHWYGKDILSVKQFSREDLEYVFGVAHEMRGMVERVGTFDLLKGKILANLFYEPSTRPSPSFTATWAGCWTAPTCWSRCRPPRQSRRCTVASLRRSSPTSG